MKVSVTFLFFFFFFSLIAGLLAVQGPKEAAAAATTCDPSELSPCAKAILYNAAPTSQCCSKLKAQSPCFCQYMKDPTLSSYLGAGRKLATTCGITLPKC